MINKLSGVVCGNFGLLRNNGYYCDSAWHGFCFKCHPDDKFPVAGVKSLNNRLDEDDYPELSSKAGEYNTARDGDSLMTPFQCVNCHFMNLKKRLPIEGHSGDRLLEICIRRATLDSFWSRAKGTVKNNQRELRKFMENMELLGIDEEALPERGPYPTNDVWGMRVACGFLLRSLDPGLNAPQAQYKTVKKLAGTFNNYCNTCERGRLNKTGAKSTLNNPVENHYWYSRFQEGAHMRMGDISSPDSPLTTPILRKCLEILEETVTLGPREPSYSNALHTGCMLIVGFFGALRGDEINLVDIGELRARWTGSVHGPHPHIPICLIGNIKGVDGGFKYYVQPLALVTDHGTDLGSWFRKLLELAGKDATGPMFKRRGSNRKATIQEMNVLFHDVLERVQERYPGVIQKDENIMKSYSMYRSPRRGSTTEAQNSKISVAVIESNNRWRKFANARSSTPNLSMMGHYTDAKAAAPTLIRYSKQLA